MVNSAFVLPELNQSVAVTDATCGTFTGYSYELPTTRYTLNADETQTNIFTHYTFNLNDGNADVNTESQNLLNFTANSKGVTAVTFHLISNFTTKAANSVYGAADDFTKFLASKVFGSESTIELFNNPDEIASGYSVASDANLLTLNNYTNSDVVKTLVNSILNKNPERFGMEYGATFATGTAPTDASMDGEYSTSVTSVEGKTSPVIKVIIDYASGNNRIGSIRVVTAGSGYVVGDSLTFTDTIVGVSKTISISSLNPFQVAMLNGVYTNIPVPVEIGDTFIVKFSTQMASTQKNAALETIGGETSQTHDAKIVILVG
jgi:hypothetical protein